MLIVIEGVWTADLVPPMPSHRGRDFAVTVQISIVLYCRSSSLLHMVRVLVSIMRSFTIATLKNTPKSFRTFDKVRSRAFCRTDRYPFRTYHRATIIKVVVNVRFCSHGPYARDPSLVPAPVPLWPRSCRLNCVPAELVILQSAITQAK